MSDNPIQLYRERTEGISRQKEYRVMALLTFCVAVALPVVRLISYYLPIRSDLVSDLVFTLLMQVGVLIGIPVLFYKFALKKNVRGMLDFSGFHAAKWYNLALAVPIGLCCHIVTIGVSSIWQSIISALGYSHGSSPMPETFSAGTMVLTLVLTGVLPGFCEEFFNRGGLLKTVRGSYPFHFAIILMGLEFGLFHQNITQVFYTALFGAYMAFLALKTKSVFPCMIIHFVNNSFSVINDYCDEYGFMRGGLYRLINQTAATRPQLLTVAFFLFCGILVGLTILLLHLNSARRLAKKKEVIASSGYDHTNKRVVLLGEEDKEKVRELGLDKEVYGHTLKEDLYKPTLADNAFFLGAIAVCVLTTVFSFIFGWIV
ncbi:MAG: CPBP family intramembrane metalloprotease [Clostridia bacterium]|jgi:membrane protease YdiL (CAAX protease family)|nr:CPBP family intramembrane metalloprotease [Clostridia bacterium]